MLEFAHAATGGLLAYKIGNPFLALPLALASHFALDLLPHWNPNLTKEKKHGGIKKLTLMVILLDCLTGLALGLFIAKQALPDLKKAGIIILGSFLGILPDLIEAPYYFFDQKIPFLRKLVAFQGRLQWNVSLPFGIIFQIGYLLLLFQIL